MINEINANPNDWKRSCYIASKIDVTYDDEGNEISVYDEPKPYEFNYQPVSTDADISEFGEKSNSIVKAVVPISYQGQFKEFDVAYLYDAAPNDETNNGDNANYRLLPPRIGNSVIIIYFEQLTGK